MNSVPLILMVCSIVLLLVLQFLWLTSAYHDARKDFQEETNSLFRNTIFAMHDSLMLRNIEPIKSDSVFRGKRFIIGNSAKNFISDDTLMDYVKIRETTAFVEVFISPDNKDSVRQILRPLVRRMRTDKNNKKFFIRLGPDSLKTDSIYRHFSLALSRSGIPIPFRVHRIQADMPGRVHSIKYPEGSLVSESVPFNPLNHYAVSFTATNRFFLKAITPQILFSIFVTLLTAGSFYLMNRSIRSQKKLMKLKNDFISNISHELKTPVSTVSVALEAMEKFKALDDRQKTNEYLNMAQNELNRLVLMTDKILQTASFENGDREFKNERMDLDAGVREVLGSMKLVFEKRKIQVRYERQGADFIMNGSRSHLVTVLYNLLDNAIKYSPESTTILIRLEDHENQITLSVKDNGIGIPAAYHKKIFEKFFRVPSGDVHNAKGYGLGLSYVASVIESHKGEIILESETGKGSCFNIRLPKM